MSDRIYNFLSLGAGVQSSTLALMAEHGEFDVKPDAAIFADTQAEPQSVYKWLEWLTGQLSYPVHVVTRGSLTDRVLDMRKTSDGRIFANAHIPFFTKDKDGGYGMVKNRACTMDYKIQPIRKKVKELAGIKRGQKNVTVRQWIGISLDEIIRIKPSRDPWCENIWPLVEKRMKRGDCFEWMRKHNYPEPPRSSCVYCPYHSDQEWRRLKNDEPESFDRAVQFEKDVQAVKSKSDNFSSTPYLHAKRQPLGEVDFSTDVDRGQMTMWDNQWNQECEGMCGV